MATLTITTTAPQTSRAVSAFGKHLKTMDVTDPANPVPRDATPAEVKAAVIQWVRDVVQHYEREDARAAADATIAGFDPS